MLNIVIYGINFKSLFSVLCAIVTGCSSSHVSIIFNGVMYDTTLSRGSFGATPRPKKLTNRHCVVYNIPTTPEQDKMLNKLLGNMEGTLYDRVGLALWILSVHNKEKLYCYESAEVVLDSIDCPINHPANRVSAAHITQSLHDMYNLTGELLTETQLWYRLDTSYYLKDS